MMRKRAIALLAFLFVFAASYFLLSFCIPGWRVKLAGPPAVVFLENLKILWPVKGSIALAVGGAAGMASFQICKMFHMERKGENYDR